MIISSQDTVLVGITEADAKAVAKTQQELAAEYLPRIKLSIDKYRKEHSLLNSLRRWFATPIVIQFIILGIGLGQYYAPGDRVQLGGIMGDVIDISILRTTLMECGDWVKADLYNGRIVRIANSFVFKAPVFNYSGDFHFVWDEITVPIKYGSQQLL